MPEYRDFGLPPLPRRYEDEFPPGLRRAPSDFDLYVPNRGGGGRYDDFDYDPRGGRGGMPPPPPRREFGNPSNFNPNFVMMEDRRDRRPMHDDYYDGRRDLSPRDHHRRMPRNDREFGASIREERRVLGDHDFQDAYRPYREDDRDSHLDYDMFNTRGRRNDMENQLGYYP